MLILVAVSISIALNTGLFDAAGKATQDWQAEQEAEQELAGGQITVGNKIYASVEDYVNGVEKILDDSLPENEYLKTFITEWKVSAGDTITLPIYEMQVANETLGDTEITFNYNFTVDYGDGTIAEITSFDDADRIHTYSTAGTYKIKIDGQCEGWSFMNVKDSAEKITKLEQWGVLGAKHIDFRSCTNLTGEIPVPSLNSFNEVENFRALFYGCTGLTGKIPANLFQYATKVVILSNAFNFSGVTGTIPEDLIANCTEITHVNFLFAGAAGLTGSIPENLLNRCNKLIYANGVFAQCPNLKGSIPSNLFKGCENLQHVGQLFNGCRGLSGEIPEQLFSDCDYLYGAHKAFQGCTGLSGSIPSNLFMNKSNLLAVQQAFYGCDGLEDSEIWLDTTRPKSVESFSDMLEGVNANITIHIPTGSYVPSAEALSSTANITIVEYDLE